MNKPDSLFQENFRYTETANQLGVDVSKAIDEMFRSYVKLGYSPRELAHIFHWAINDIELECVLDIKQEVRFVDL